MKYSEDIYEMIAKIIKKVPAWWEVTFEWLKHPYNTTLITPKDLKCLTALDEYWRTVNLISDSSLWDQILERAYWRLRKHRADVNNGVNTPWPGVREIPGIGSDMTRATYAFDRGSPEEVLTHHWGFSHIVFQDLFWYTPGYFQLHNVIDINSLRRWVIDFQERKGIFTVSTKASPNWDRATFELRALNGSHTLSRQHAYSAYYDETTDIITIINPHNTHDQQYTLRLTDFLGNENFEDIETGTPANFWWNHNPRDRTIIVWWTAIVWGLLSTAWYLAMTDDSKK